MKQRVVIKLGGSMLQSPATLQELATTVVGYRQRGYDVVLVHGGGPAINEELTRRGIEWKFINGQRQTTPEMIDVIEEVLAKKVNAMVVTQLRECGVSAQGLSGAQGILQCVHAAPELMQVGQIENVNIEAIEAVLSQKTRPVPVIAPVGYGENEMKFNINADWAATKIAIALNAKKLIFLTDQNGILDADKNLVRKVTPRRLHLMIEMGIVSGGMRTKVLAMLAALEMGVYQVRVLHAGFSSQVLGRIKIGTVLKEEYSSAQKAVLHEYAS